MRLHHPDPGAQPLRVAYVAWFYPVISMTFVQREVAALRARGVEVHTTAVRRPPPEHLLTEVERTSARETWTVLPVTFVAAVLGHLRGLLRSPSAYLSALRAAFEGAVPGRGMRSRVTPLFYFAEAVLLAEHLRRQRLDHVHAHGGDVGCEVARLVAHLERRRRRRRPFTWSFTLHGPGELLDPRAFGLARKVEDADLVVAITEYCRAQLLPLVAPVHWDKVQVVHCGVDVARWARRAPGGPGTPLRLLTVGRLHPQKSHHVLIAALDLLRQRGVEVRLTLVGEGETRPDLERELRERGLSEQVHLVGAVGQSEVGAYFSSHDLFCLASVSEGLPVVLMEAMAAGLPVVTTRITGVPELVEDGRSGLLVPPARPDLLADALQKVCVDEDLRQRLAAGGREAVSSGFDIADCAAQLEAHLQRVRRATEAAPRA